MEIRDKVNNEDYCYLTIVTDDGNTYTISYETARGSEYLSSLIDDLCVKDPVTVRNVSSDTMELIIEYLEHFKNLKPTVIPKPLPSKPFKMLVNEWEYLFVNIELPTIFSLISAANFLRINSLLELCAAKIANEIRGRSVEEIRSILMIENDFTAEEEAKIRQETKWYTTN